MAKGKRFRLLYRKENDVNSGIGIIDMEHDGLTFVAWNDDPTAKELDSLRRLVRLANERLKEKRK